MITGLRASIVCSWNVETANPGWYGGSKHKRESDDGWVPTAWTFYDQLQSEQGSAYSKERSGPLHWENLADARMCAATQRAAEKIQRNAVPLSSDECLRYWVELLAVTVSPYDTDEDIRENCDARFKGFSGNSYIQVQRTIESVLGAAFDSVDRFIGVNFGTPPPITNWPKTGGFTSNDLGHGLNGASGETPTNWRRGPWTSPRCRILIRIKRGALSPARQPHMMNVVLRETLERLLPVWVTWQWSYAGDFILDQSQLDVNALSPPEE